MLALAGLPVYRNLTFVTVSSRAAVTSPQFGGVPLSRGVGGGESPSFPS